MATKPGAGLGGGRLLDELVVKVTYDDSEVVRGVPRTIALVRSLKEAIVAKIGGLSLSDALTAALVTPLILATARIGQMRNELRLLTSELRAAASIGFAGSGAAAIAGGAAAGAVLDASPRVGADGRPVVGRGRNGRFTRAFDVADLSGGNPALALGGAFAGGLAGRTGRDRVAEIFDQDDEARRLDEADEAGPPRRRRRNWFERTFSPTRADRAFQVGRREFPGFGQAADDLGMAANTTGRAIRGAAGGRIAQALGLAGLGTLISSLIPLAGSLATVVGGTLAGAFAALVTPLGLVVAAFTALAAIWVAANWESFREFAEWFGEEGKKNLGEGWGDIVSGWTNLKDAVGELATVLKEAFSDDSGSLSGALQFFGDVATRVLSEVMSLFGRLLDTVAESVRALAALLRGDLQGVLDHMLAAVRALFPEWTALWTGIATTVTRTFGGVVDWVKEKAGEIGEAFAKLYDDVIGHSYVPDLVTGIGDWFGRLDELMVRPARAAAASVAEVFSSLEGHVLSGIEGALLGKGFSGEAVLRGVAGDLLHQTARQATERASSFISPIIRGAGAAVSSLFSGFFADGGVIPAGRWGIVGERGPEFAYGGRNGLTVRPANDGGPRALHVTYDLRGAEGDVSIERKIARANAALLRQVNAAAPARMDRFQALGS